MFLIIWVIYHKTKVLRFQAKKVWFSFSQLLDDTPSRNEDLNESFSSRKTSIESWDEVTPYRNDNDVRSEFPVKDIFSIGVQTIRQSTQKKGSQYHNIMIKNKLTQTIDGPRLFMRRVSTQTLPIPCTCADSEKNGKFAGSGKSYMASTFLHFLWQRLHNEYFKLLFQEF